MALTKVEKFAMCVLAGVVSHETDKAFGNTSHFGTEAVSSAFKFEDADLPILDEDGEILMLNDLADQYLSYHYSYALRADQRQEMPWWMKKALGL